MSGLWYNDLLTDLLQLWHPWGGKVAVLQHHPGTLLDRLVYHISSNGTLQNKKYSLSNQIYNIKLVSTVWLLSTQIGSDASMQRLPSILELIKSIMVIVLFVPVPVRERWTDICCCQSLCLQQTWAGQPLGQLLVIAQRLTGHSSWSRQSSRQGQRLAVQCTAFPCYQRQSSVQQGLSYQDEYNEESPICERETMNKRLPPLITVPLQSYM